MLDILLHARALDARALSDLLYFGVEGALVPSDDSVAPATGAAVRRGWEETAAAARRLRRAGLAGRAALGVHPNRIPLRGLEALLAELPELLSRPEVAAVGAIGLAAGGELEERVLTRQLELARELRLPVLVTTPAANRERLTRRVIALLRDAEVEPARALVLVDLRTVRVVRACGHVAVLSLSGSDGPRGGIDAAARVVASLGPEGIALGSDAGLAGGDLLALPRAADRLARLGLEPAVIRRVCGGTAARLLGVEPSGRRPAARGARV
jgi:uncharacterized protein